MDVARQTNPHSEGCEEGGREKRKFHSVTSQLLLALTQFEVVKKMNVQASLHQFLAFFSDERRRTIMAVDTPFSNYYDC
jgi:hypothetical protein